MVASTDSLLVKYRPTEWGDFVGHEAVIRSLQSAIKSNQRVFIFGGEAGVGKTSFSFHVARLVGCKPNDIIDIDAATHSGIDKMRALTDGLAYRPLGGGKRAIVIDEAQGLSKSAWDSLLKSTENPDPWTYWFFCTTVPEKIPKALQTRGAVYLLKAVPTDAITNLLDEISVAEGFRPIKGLLNLCAREAKGSPRQGINNLMRTHDCMELSEAADLIESTQESSAAIDLCRALIQGKNWAVIKPVLAGLKEAGVNPESVRYTVLAYVSTAIMDSKTAELPVAAFNILENFSMPFPPGEAPAALLLAVGRVMAAKG